MVLFVLKVPGGGGLGSLSWDSMWVTYLLVSPKVLP